MKKIILGVCVLLLFACKKKDNSSKLPSKESLSIGEEAANKKQFKDIPYPAFNDILEKAEITGSILVYDFSKKTYYSNDFKRCETGYIPASTFKIPNSLVALETGVVKDENTIMKWNGRQNRIKAWNRDLKFRDAFHYSCVPCYQEIARKVGDEPMQQFMEDFEYGEMDIDFTTIDQFWLIGDSRISQRQQIDFLQKFYQSKLPISKRTEQIAKKMMTVEHNDSYTLLGKTGLSSKGLGWYVGWLETNKKVYFFATNIDRQEPFDFNTRKSITLEALKSITGLSSL